MPIFDIQTCSSMTQNTLFVIDMAREKAPCVILIDEIDSFVTRPDDSVAKLFANEAVSQLCSEMDKYVTTSYYQSTRIYSLS